MEPTQRPFPSDRPGDSTGISTATVHPRLLAAMDRLNAVAAVAVAALGFLVLVGGWALGIEPLTGVMPGFPTMKVNTALGFILAGLSLLLWRNPAPRAHRLAALLGALVALIGAVSLAQYVSGLNFGIDELFFRDHGSAFTSHPGRMSSNTALSFLFAGSALVLLPAAAAEWLAMAGLLPVLLSGTGYLYGAHSFIGVLSLTGMALPTVAAFLLLTMGIIAARPLRGIGLLLLSRGPEGTVIRRLLPAGLGTLVVTAVLTLLGHDAGFYGEEFRDALYLFVSLLALAVFIIGVTRTLARVDDERKKSAAALAESEARYRALFEKMISGFAYHRIILDGRGKPVDYLFLEVNSAFERLTGLRGGEIVGKRVTEVLPCIESDPADWIGTYGRVALSGEEITFEQYSETLGKWFSVSAYSPLREYFVAVFEDITERKRAEAALRESEKLFRSALNNIPDVFVIYDAERRFRFVNGWGLELTGRTEDELLGHRDEEVFPHEMTEGYLPTLLAAYASRTDLSAEFTFRIGGETYFETVTYVPLLDETGEIRQVLGITHDITERKQAEEELRRAKDELEHRVTERTIELATTVETLLEEITEREKAEEALKAETVERIRAIESLREKDRMMLQQSRMAAMGEMLGNIAHQWRQPLNALGLTVQELGLSFECGQFSKEHLDASIDKAMEIISHLSQTIDNFRNFSRPDKAKSYFGVNPAVARTVALIEESFREQHISIEVATSGDPHITGYPNEYAQVILNILVNARDALLERQMSEARVTVRSWVEGGRTVVTISDNAGGIKEEIMDRIFDPYFTTKELGKGSGVGLYQAKTIIEKNMGGSLSARNVGEGAEFRIEV